MTPVPFEYVGSIINRGDLIKPSSARDKDLTLIDEIDCSRLTTEKAGKGKNSYSIKELQDFAKKANIKSSMSKGQLVEQLRKLYCF